MPEWLLGLDGGGTKTLLALANQNGDVLGPFVGAGINPFDQPNWKAELATLFKRCPIAQGQLAFSSFGLPGYGESATINAQQLEAVQAFAGTNCIVTNDVALAFVGALAGKPGALILAGTGSMAWASNGNREIRVGGFGDGFGDEGSAYWIGQQALQKLSWVLDGRLDDDAYRDAMLKVLHASTSEDVITWFYSLDHQRSRVAGLAQTIDQLAEAKIITAKNILLEAAKLLAAHVHAAWQKLELTPSASISYAGSVFKSHTVRDSVRSQLEKLGRWEAPIAAPITGALIDAATRAGWSVRDDWVQHVNTTLENKIARA